MRDLVSRFRDDRSGATAIEYCLIAGVVSMAVVGGALTIGAKLNSFFLELGAALP